MAKAASIAFTIDLPVALLKDAEVKDGYATWEPKHAWVDSPSFTVLFTDMPARTEPSESPMPIGDDAKDRKIVRNEKLSDGAILTLDQRTDRAFYELQVCRGVASGTLCCSVIQRGEQGKALEAFDAIVAMAEKVCRSVKPKG